MKYLRKFNENINIQDIKDICLELQDLPSCKELKFGSIRSTVPYDNPKFKSGDHIKYIYFESKSGTSFTTLADIKDCCLRLRDYLGDYFLSMNILLVQDGALRRYNMDELFVPDKLSWCFSTLIINYVDLYK